MQDGTINSASAYNSDFWLINAWYIRLKTVDLGYQLPKTALPKFLDNVRFYVNAYNLLTFTGYDKYQQDPESIIGDISKKYFVTSTKYSDGYQYISSVTDEFGNTTKYEYDYVSGLLEKVIDAKNTSTNYIYDEYERLTQILTNSRKITYTYDTKGRVQTVEVGNLTNYIQYQFTYNGYNDIVSIP